MFINEYNKPHTLSIFHVIFPLYYFDFNISNEFKVLLVLQKFQHSNIKRNMHFKNITFQNYLSQKFRRLNYNVMSRKFQRSNFKKLWDPERSKFKFQNYASQKLQHLNFPILPSPKSQRSNLKNMRLRNIKFHNYAFQKIQLLITNIMNSLNNKVLFLIANISFLVIFYFLQNFILVPTSCRMCFLYLSV